MKRLGGYVVEMGVAESSMQKGESLQHATAVMTSYVLTIINNYKFLKFLGMSTKPEFW